MSCYQNIPDELKQLNQWVCASCDSKVPMKSFAYEAASSTNEDTWSDFETAVQSVSDGHYDYAGFVFNDNGIVGIDIDCGFDDDGFISELAADIIERCKSYTEKSKSGRGFHILVKGSLPFKGKNNLGGVEIYNDSRYFIMTGDKVLYGDIIDNQGAIDYVVKKYFPETREDKEKTDNRNRVYSPNWSLPKEGERIKLRPEYPRIPDGSRNICLTSLAGLLHTIGYTKKQIYDELIYCNKTACDPPVSQGELQNICNSVARYKR